ncbi:glycosyltransferase family 4 protein [Noviherbaspirillum massiliense]|uniref:glycosyltransferase family 4 protein n=1 Tax=Noviherbaspirillum massiliense TaxID=1465823 RepID=UPI0003679CB2|nr:glycosyltransferase family 4 protein [Noviherbaspirillum massiliense]
MNDLVIFIHSMGSGGAERVTANMANYWAAKGWEITIVTLAPRSLDFYELHPSVKRVALNSDGDSGNVLAGLLQNLHRVLALRRVLREIRPRIALAMMTTANVLLAMAAFGLNVRVIGSEHTHPPQYPLSALWERLRRLAYRWLDAVTALTSESAHWLKVHTSARRVPVIPNAAPWPLPVQEPRLSPDAVCRPGRKLMLAAGRLVEYKGFDWLIEAFANLAHKHPSWDLVILGDGPQSHALQAQLRAAELEERIFLPGRAGNVGEWYERADLYVMSSRFEGFGNTLAEALTYGVPAVSFDCDTGPREIIRHEVDGLLVPPEDVAGLTAVLDRVMGDDEMRQSLAARAVEARDRFSMERIAGMWEELFKASAR